METKDLIPDYTLQMAWSNTVQNSNLLARIITELLKKRAEAKTFMNNSKDSNIIYRNRQLALNVCFESLRKKK